ncbi:DUF2283 domain-containing protein, partial [Bradyrhizobium sp.]|uniref:DUF2283 domain-containing protein n=1 Tax=Bradyrhizobium sp. TaxID=376 RepID=UPI002732ED7B
MAARVSGGPFAGYARTRNNSAIKALLRSSREPKAMTNITYDAEADAVYITVGRGKVDRTEETGPFNYDVDAEGHIVGIE